METATYEHYDVPILLAYMPLVIPQPYYGVALMPTFGWILSVPAVAILVAMYFRQAPDPHS